MLEAQEHLRLKYEAETDKIINESILRCQPYAQWLEKLQVEKLQNKIIKENNILRCNLQKAADILDKAITARFD